MDRRHKNKKLIGVISDTHGLVRPEALRALAGADLIIHAGDKGKQVLSADNSGPWFYVQLSPGASTVKATYKGKVKEIKNLRLAKNGKVQRTIFWDVD
jgi:hypothetical protein